MSSQLSSTITQYNNPPLGGSTDFLLACVELNDASSCTAWFTRNVQNAIQVSNFSVSGPTLTAISIAQYINPNAVRLYFSSPFSVGQWVFSFKSSGPETLISDDQEQLTLPANTQAILELIDLYSVDPMGQNDAQGPVSKALPQSFQNSKLQKAIIESLEDSDQVTSDNAQLAVAQSSLYTASGQYLISRARDRGVGNPSYLGMKDDSFRTMAIDVVNSKLTTESFLCVLEDIFGSDSVRGYVETLVKGPFRAFDNGNIDFISDGKNLFTFRPRWADFKNPMNIPADELAAIMNFYFARNDFKAYALTQNNKVRVYSASKGQNSSMAVSGGTLQPYFQFDSPIFGDVSSIEVPDYIPWTITYPRLGVARLQNGSASRTFIDMGGDASASRRSAWMPLNGHRQFCLDLNLPSTGTPIGVVSVELSDSGAPGVHGFPISTSALPGLTQPSGTSWSCLIDNIVSTAPYFCLVYTRTSGGAGAAFNFGYVTGPDPTLAPNWAQQVEVGDYVTIIGRQFPANLLGSREIINVNYTFDTLDSTAPTQWIEVNI